ncbi:MAG TPA: M23 family metallopeptidase [Anaeromyxobacter sp.]|nr:M23 family metallopeptidase [Anaeromyxobacter sp.]
MPRAPVRAKLTALAVASALAACGSSPARKMTFAEAGLAATSTVPEDAASALEPEESPPPPVDVPAPESIASELPEGPPVDATLLRFAAAARDRRAAQPGGRGFPDEAAKAWRTLAADLDAYLCRALPQTPLLELVRARVTVEAEWDYDQRRYGRPPADLAGLVESRAARFGRRIDAARALGFALFTRPPPAKLRWPVEQAGLSSLFGMRIHPVEGRRRMHYGVDLAAAPGRVVSAAAAGWVVRAGWTGGYGLMVELRHPGDVTTRYSHLSAILCGPGDEVETGRPLGLVGKTGVATGPHLHFEVWRGGEATDPLPWLGITGNAGS